MYIDSYSESEWSVNVNLFREHKQGRMQTPAYI